MSKEYSREGKFTPMNSCAGVSILVPVTRMLQNGESRLPRGCLMLSSTRQRWCSFSKTVLHG